MTAERCQTCRYADGQGRNDWRCRRRAPVVDFVGGERRGIPRLAAFPAIEKTDWCGEWQKIGAPTRPEPQPETVQERMWDRFWNGRPQRGTPIGGWW